MQDSSNKKSFFCRLFCGLKKSIQFLIVLLIGLASIYFFYGLSKIAIKHYGLEPVEKKEQKQVLIIDYSSLDIRGSVVVDSLVGVEIGTKKVPTLIETVKAIKAAATDDNITGLYINLSNHNYDFAKAEELSRALSEFTIASNNKPILVSSNYYGNTNYFIASHATKILLDKHGLFNVRPYYLGSNWEKGYYDKIGVSVNSARVGDYKSALAPTMFSDIIGEAVQENRVFYGEVQKFILNRIMKNRGLTADDLILSDQDKFDAIGLDGTMVTTAASKVLIDYITTTDVSEIENSVFTDAVNKKTKQVDGISVSNYIANSKDPIFVDAPKSGDYIGYYALSGDFSYDSDESTSVVIHDAQRIMNIAKMDNPPKVLLIAVDSPGGAVVTSESILHSLDYLKSKGIKLVMSQGGLSASAGYMVVAPGDYIVTNNLTLTGSIGVYMEDYGAEKYLQQYLGLNSSFLGDTVRGYKKFHLPFTDIVADYIPSVGRKEMFQSSVNILYHNFIAGVAKGRGLPIDYIDSIARGRIWPGMLAKRIGLVDDIGGISRAYEVAQNLAQGLSADYKRIYKDKQFIGNEDDIYTLAHSIREGTPIEGRDKFYAKDVKEFNKDLKLVHLNERKPTTSLVMSLAAVINNEAKILQIMWSQNLKRDQAKLFLNSFSSNPQFNKAQARLVLPQLFIQE